MTKKASPIEILTATIPVEMEREQTELDAAETLLQLHSTDVDTEPDNDELLPVDAPKLDDFTKDMAEAEAENATETIGNKNDGNEDEIEEDDAATVIYEPEPQSKDTSPTKRGQVTFKHYGI